MSAENENETDDLNMYSPAEDTAPNDLSREDGSGSAERSEAGTDSVPAVANPPEGGQLPGTARSGDEGPAKLDAAAAAEIGKQIADSFKQSMPEKPAPEQKSLSPEDRDKLLRRQVVSAQHLESLGFRDVTPDQVTSFQQLMDGVAEHGYTMAQVQVELAKRQLQEQIAPMQQYWEEQQLQQAETYFYGKYEALKPYSAAVQHAAQQTEPFNSQGKPKTNDEIVEEVATRAVAIVKSFIPDFDLKAQTSAPVRTSAKAAVPSMAAVHSGGRSQGNSPVGGATDDINMYAD